MQSKFESDLSTLEWVKASGGVIPQNSFVGGHQETGEKLFVARASYGGGVHIGKIRPGFEGCMIGWGGSEIQLYEYEVLQVCNGDWVKAYAGHTPHNAIKGGHESDGSPIYIGRVHFKGGIQIGKVKRAYKGCNFSYGDQELGMAEYEVLVPGKYWVDAKNGFIPEGAMSVRDPGEDPQIIGRVRHEGAIIPGKMWVGYLHFPHKGKEVLLKEYQILKNIPGKWVAAKDGEIPKGAFYCGKEADGTPIYLARAIHENEIHAGKIRNGCAGALIPWGGIEHLEKEYDVFVPSFKINPEF